MAMITCKECGKEFSDKADKCPNCGAPIEVPQAPKKMSKCLLISLIIGAAYLIYSLQSMVLVRWRRWYQYQHS